MSIQIIRSGPLTTVQDQGRFGYQDSGIGTAGVMDHAAMAACNRLVGNAANAAVLEMTICGAVFSFQRDAICALTGADMQATLDGQPVERYRAFSVSSGQTLALSFVVSGCRGYLAVRGGIDVPVIMGSRSTDLKSRIGGLGGRALRPGDVLPIGNMTISAPLKKQKLPIPVYSDNIRIRVILGPQNDYFTTSGIHVFFNEVYTVSAKSDRMGIRLDGKAIESSNGVDIVSDGIVFGSIQIPSNGQPIILMADHQTTGGYAKIAVVVNDDLSLLAQAKPGDHITFQSVTVQETQKSFGLFSRLFRRK